MNKSFSVVAKVSVLKLLLQFTQDQCVRIPHRIFYHCFRCFQNTCIKPCSVLKTFKVLTRILLFVLIKFKNKNKKIFLKLLGCSAVLRYKFKKKKVNSNKKSKIYIIYLLYYIIILCYSFTYCSHYYMGHQIISAQLNMIIF